MHKCPVPNCLEQVDDAKLMCRAHWRLVPVELQRQIYASYRNKSPGHWKLCVEAVRAVVKPA